MPEILWFHADEGEQPDVLLGEGRILMHYTAVSGGHKGIELLCYDFEGRRLWRRPGLTCLLSLPGGRFVVNTPEGRPMAIDSDGQVMHRSGFGGIERAVRHGEMLLFAGKNEIYATDCCLRGLREIAWPGQSASAIDCFVDGAIYWVEGNCLRRCTLDGPPEDLCPLPRDLIAETMDEWERTMEISALVGWYSRTDMSGSAAFKTGDRPFCFYWRVAFDAAGQQFFLANAVGPHLVLCLDRTGCPRWCTYLWCGCCGGVPVVLPNGLYVASSGCGGILSWLDREGKVLFQSVPHKGEGLATAYTSDVRVLPDSRCLADGGPGIVAYGPRGELEWIFPHSYSRFCCDPVKRIMVGCHWRTNDSRTKSVWCLECSEGL
jgi:hypothetical protein